MSVDRGFTWMDDETVALIDIWSKDDVQHELTSAKRNFSVYERIARELADIGFSRTAYQCREKIKRLRKEYQLARYCVQNSVSQKRPMKYFERVDKVFSRDASFQNLLDIPSIASSDQEEECISNQDKDFPSSDLSLNAASLSCTSNSMDEMQGNCLKSDETSSPYHHQDSNDDKLITNEPEATMKDFDNDDTESPWVPSIVLVENENGENNNFNDLNLKAGMSDINKEMPVLLRHQDQMESLPPVSEEFPNKKQKKNPKASWFKGMMDKVTEKFIKYQEESDARFLERITALERERLKRDEAMQRLWMEFEERRRKEEQQHELRMMSLFGQFVSHLVENENTSSNRC